MRKVHKNAAGADLGSKEIFIATHLPEVKTFKTYTVDLKAAVAYLLESGVQTLAMEATGVYWYNIYHMAKEAGIDVFLVNPYDSRNLPGRKTDVLDCQWIQKLHTHGLLRRCFVPEESIQQMRHYMRLREDHIQMASMHIQHMQKALISMNIQLTGLISQVQGKSGMAMIDAIINGERDPDHLLALCSTQIIRKKGEEVRKALEGNYLPQYIFALRQARDLYRFYDKQISECDQQISDLMAELNAGKPLPRKSKAKPVRHHAPEIKNLHEHILLLCNGNDVTRIPGLTDYSALKIISEVGTDMTLWPTVKHFTSWLGLAPKQNQSGKMRKRSKRRPSNNAGQVFRVSAQSLIISKHNALGAFGRRIKSRKGPFAANKALARKIAEMYYRVLTQGLEYVEQGVKIYNEQFAQNRMKYLLKATKKLELEIAMNQCVNK